MNFSRTRAVLSLLCMALCTAAHAQKENWITSWATAPIAIAPGTQLYVPLADGATVSETVHLSAAGTQIRVRFSNAFGGAPLTLDHATVVMHGEKRPVAITFAGQTSVTIPAGAPYYSDPISLSVPPLADLDIQFQVLQFTSVETTHEFADATGYVTGRDGQSRKPIHVWPFLNAVEVSAPADAFTIVCLGDSITDGDASTGDANHRYPDELARRLQANKKTANIAVANAGIGGNRLLNDVAGQNTLARFDRDVLAQPGVKYVIVLEAINDIIRSAQRVPGAEVTVAQLTAAYRQIITRAHTHGIRVIGATLTPTTVGPPESQTMLDAVNDFIRSGGTFDAVVDLNAAVRDPANPRSFVPLYDSGDHLHPGDAGYKAMADAIDLALFTK